MCFDVLFVRKINVEWLRYHYGIVLGFIRPLSRSSALVSLTSLLINACTLQ